MKKSICIAWIEALRSGNYKQHRGSMTDRQAFENKQFSKADAFCCLGVGVLIDCKLNNTNPDEARFFHGVGHDIGINGHEQSILIYMNDMEKYSFPEIADYIEANILPNCTEG